MPVTAIRSILAGLLFSIIAAGPSWAQSVQVIGDYNDWSAYSASGGSGRMCFVMAKPTSVDPTPDGYTQAYLYLTHRPADNVRNEFNFVAGYTFAQDDTATATIGSQVFELFTKDDAAWLKDPSQGNNIAGLMRAGSTIVVEGTSDKGIKVTATFSLSGVTAASRAIDGACG